MKHPYLDALAVLVFAIVVLRLLRRGYLAIKAVRTIAEPVAPFHALDSEEDP